MRMNWLSRRIFVKSPNDAKVHITRMLQPVTTFFLFFSSVRLINVTDNNYNLTKWGFGNWFFGLLLRAGVHHFVNQDAFDENADVSGLGS